ncbi:MAG: vitamin B12-dependent ribonucleotide reductase [Candidatus Odinarchaeota archaeon]
MMMLTENALKVLEKRYLAKNKDRKVIETPEEMFRRVATNIAEAGKLHGETDIEETAEKFFKVMAELEFLPNSPTLMNAGRELQQLSACFVLPIEDSMDSIFDAVKSTALIHKSGGGTGFSFSKLRAKDSVVGSTGGIASGPVSFMRVFNAATETVKQGGTRRGANMGILRVDHPDIKEFITCKDNPAEMTNFNLSVTLTDEFMKAVKDNQKYAIIDPRTNETVEKRNANEIFDLIVKQAWKNGEPGIIFIDKINAANPILHIGNIEATNPCGEQPLLPLESCNLGSINLARFLKNGMIDWDRMATTVHAAVKFLDNVIDMNNYPLPEIEEQTKANRKIGLGVMGFADLLIKLKIPYNSPKAVEMAKKVMKFINDESKKASSALAETRGSFPNWKGSAYEKKGLKMRNATTTTIAPTGSISIIAGASSGVEPHFALVYTRTVMDNDRLLEVNPYLKDVLNSLDLNKNEILEKIAESGTLAKVKEIPVEISKIFKTAHDLTPEDHVRIQAAFQKFTDNAVSKTINMPNKATEEDVKNAYLLAYDLGCKGITVYRDGSRTHQVLATAGSKKEKGETAAEEKAPRPRPDITSGATVKINTGCGKLYVTINEDEHGLCEVFARMGKSGGCASSQSEATGRLVSLALRSGIGVEPVIKQLRGIRCPSPSWGNGGATLSCSDAISKALERYIKQRKMEAYERFRENISDKNINGKAPECPDCGSLVEYESGCVVCKHCGYSEC